MHVMLDLETLGKSPRAVILQIAAVEFDPRPQGLILDAACFNVHIKIDEQPGRVIDGDTLMWWMSQPDIARQHLIDGQHSATSLRLALQRLRMWIGSRRTEPEGIWCKNVVFDLGILCDAYATLGEDPPWHYRKPRDLRSYFVPHDPPKLTFEGTAHSAVDDCVNQIKTLQAGWRG